MTRFIARAVSIGALMLVTACAQVPLAPSPGVTPGLGKTPADFQADDQACRALAASAVAGQVKAANQQVANSMAVGMAVGNTTGDTAKSGLAASQDAQGSIQQQYDAVYGPCMFQRGEMVPGMEPVPVAAAPMPEHLVVRDPLVAQVQAGLIQLGYLHGSADGVAGKKTDAAIRQFETDKGMTVDGVASHSLAKAIGAAAAGGGAAPAGGGMAMPPPAAPGGMAMPPPPAK